MPSALPIAALAFSGAVVLLALYSEHFYNLTATVTTSWQAPFVSNEAIAYDAGRNITYVGERSARHVDHFQGIFYAEDTSGLNRFKAPIPVVPSPGAVVDATSSGAWCPQGTGDLLPFSSHIDNISEHCLSLRVARPAGIDANAKLPVMVWIFSGGHALGSAYEKLYDPDGLVAQSAVDGQPVVYVAMNYRVGMFGFAFNEALIKEKNTNLGLRDQQAAFEWVQKNIAAFGGDPEAITAFGHSVGGLDIGLHLLSYGGKASLPFRKAVMLSGSPGLAFNADTDFAKERTFGIAQTLGCLDGPSDDGQSSQTLDCLRKISMSRLVNVSVSEQRAARPVFGELYYSVAVDGDFLVDRPSELMKAGKVAQGVPLILSWVTNDGAWYPMPTTTTDAEVVASFKLWLFNLSPTTTEKLLSLYPVSDFMHKSTAEAPVSPQYYRAAQISRDVWFTCPSIDFAWQYARHGGVGVRHIRMFELNATRYLPVFDMMGVPMWGVSHLSDVPYVMNTKHLDAGADNSADQLALSRLVSSSIVRFAYSDSPEGSPSGVSQWPPVFESADKASLSKKSPNALTLQLFGGPHGSGAVSVDGGSATSAASKALAAEKVLERCAFLNSDPVRAEIGS